MAYGWRQTMEEIVLEIRRLDGGMQMDQTYRKAPPTKGPAGRVREP